jgi:hypothetical protein
MPASVIDDSILLKLIVGQLNSLSLVVRVMGEPERDLSEVAAEVIRLRVEPHDRIRSDGQEDIAAVEFEIVGVVGAIAQETALNTVTRVAMAIAQAFDEQRLYDATTDHELVIDRVTRDIESAGGDSDGQEGPFAIFRLTARGMARRTTGTSITAP